MHIRVGYGYDVHRLEAGRRFMLGGVDLGAAFGPVAHSDGDALVHAICDALLGAAALGDIGRHFPDTSEEYRGIASLELLERTRALLAAHGWQIGNVDATVLLERPKIAPHKDAMVSAIADCLTLDTGAVSVKATTMETLDAIGEGRGVAAHAVVLIHRT